MPRRLLATALLCGLALALFLLGDRLRGRGRSTDLTLVDTHREVDALLAERVSGNSNVTGRGPFRIEPLDEATARALFPMPEGSRVFNPFCYYRLRPGLELAVPWPEHPRGSWTRRTNSLGLREDDERSFRDGDLRILVTGDSHTDGLCDNSDSFTNRLEALLAARHPDQRVVALNTGVAGYSFYNYLGVLEEALSGVHGALPQVFVVAIYGGNDFVESLRLQHYFRGTLQPPRSTHYWDRVEAAKRISTNALGQGLNQTAYFREHPEEIDVALEASRVVLQEIVRRCREHGVRPVFLHLPAAFDRPWPALLPLIEKALASLGLAADDLAFGSELEGHLREQIADTEAEYVDLAEHFAGEPPCYWESDLHLNLHGHAVVARVLDGLLASAPPDLTQASGERAAPDGPFRRLDPSGTARLEGAYLDGLEHGLWSAYHASGERRSRGAYERGLREGLWEWWYPGGGLQKRGAYRAGRPEGRWEEWFRDGTLRRSGPWVAGAGEGLWKEWHANGQLASEGRFQAGQFEGEWRFYFPSGALESRTQWRSDQRHGPSDAWYEDGTLRARGAFLDGLRHGPCVFYWPDGAPRAEGEYAAGKRVGPTRFYDERGELDPELSGIYADGARVAPLE